MKASKPVHTRHRPVWLVPIGIIAILVFAFKISACGTGTTEEPTAGKENVTDSTTSDAGAEPTADKGPPKDTDTPPDAGAEPTVGKEPTPDSGAKEENLPETKPPTETDGKEAPPTPSNQWDKAIWDQSKWG